MWIEVSVGEALDRYSILLIKQERIKDQEKLVRINEDISLLRKAIGDGLNRAGELKLINEKIWDINEKRKNMIVEGEFGEEFVKLSILESALNDDRFLAKNKIDRDSGSCIREQKSYHWA